MMVMVVRMKKKVVLWIKGMEMVLLMMKKVVGKIGGDGGGGKDDNMRWR